MSTFHYQGDTLYCESSPLAGLIDVYDSPLYVYSQKAIIDNYQAFDSAFGNKAHLVCYAVKANSNLSVLSTLVKQGAGFDVVSQGELIRVIKAGGNPNRCVFSGVAKTKKEIEHALNVGILCFNVESASELLRINKVAEKMQLVAPISIRINPDIDAKTHPYISTGLKDNKFGVAIDQALELYEKAQTLHGIAIKGIDYHIGSQITTLAPFLSALDRILTLVKILENKGICVEHLDLGGGVGISYEENEEVLDIKRYVDEIIAKTQGYQIILEPGRAIVGNAGVFITKVEFLKQNEVKSFAIIDGAMNDLLRPALYSAYHQVLPLKRHKEGIQANWDLVGPVCETADFLAKNTSLNLKEGDLLAVASAGAYGFVMSSNYNTRGRVAEVMIDNDTHRLIRKRETIDDLLANELL